MKSQLIKSLFITLLFSCNTLENNKSKKPILLANRETPIGWVYLRIYQDSTFEFELAGLRKGTKYSGKARITQDTIFFNYRDSIPKAGSVAVYSKNLLTYIDGEYPERVEITFDGLRKNNK